MENIQVLPGYKTILAEMGKHISERKMLLTKRAVSIIWPAMILAGIFTWTNTDLKNASSKVIGGLSGNDGIGGMLTAAGILLVIVYVITVRAIVAVEKRVWLDSYFDSKNLTSQESLRIARKLFWPALKLSITILFRFYGWFGVIAIIAIAAFSFVAGNLDSTLTPFIIIFIILSVPFYLYYINLKLRFVWLVFLYKINAQRYKITSIINEDLELNKV